VCVCVCVGVCVCVCVCVSAIEPLDQFQWNLEQIEEHD
jgi:hypothetical protein